jgi:uracil-DNA glycosylase
VLRAQVRLGPESDDSLAHSLRALLAEALIPRSEVVMGSALLCRAASAELEKSVPTSCRIHECREHVRELVLALRPRLLIALGRVAISSLHQAFPGEEAILALRFPGSVGRTAVWDTGYVHLLHLPTSRERAARPRLEQIRDWRALGEIWRWIALGERGPMPTRRGS